MALVGFEFGLDFGAQRVEDVLRGCAFLEDADRQAAGAGADEESVARDLGLENEFGRQEVAECLGGLAAFGEVLLDHGEADAEDREARIDHPQAVEAFEQFGDRADAERFRLLGDQDGVARRDDVAGDAEQPGGGVDQAEVEAAGGGAAEEGADTCEVASVAAGAGVVVAGLATGHQGKGFKPGGDDQAVEWDSRVGEKIVKAGEEAGLAGQRKADGALRVGIDQQGSDPGAGEGVGEIDGYGGFTHPTFLAGYGDTDHTFWRIVGTS